MTITLSKEHIDVILLALEAFERMRIGQFDIALDLIFPKKSLEMGREKLYELAQNLKKEYFPEYPGNGGMGILHAEVGKEAHIAYELEAIIRQYVELKSNNGWHTGHRDCAGPVFNVSKVPYPKIEGLDEMMYKDYMVPMDIWKEFDELYEKKDYTNLWKLINDNMKYPKGDSIEIIKNSVDGLGYVLIPYVRVHKPRKAAPDSNF